MRIKKTYLFIGLFIAMVILGLAGAYGLRIYASKGPSEHDMAPNFTETTLSGDTISLSEYRGQFVLLDFWGTWCGPCIKEIPHLKEVRQHFGDELAIIGIPVNDDSARVQKLVEKHHITWPQLSVQTSGFRGSGIPWDYGINQYPTLFLIDPNGKILLNSDSDKDYISLQGERLLQTLKKYVKG